MQVSTYIRKTLYNAFNIPNKEVWRRPRNVEKFQPQVLWIYSQQFPPNKIIVISLNTILFGRGQNDIQFCPKPFYKKYKSDRNMIGYWIMKIYTSEEGNEIIKEERNKRDEIKKHDW